MQGAGVHEWLWVSECYLFKDGCCGVWILREVWFRRGWWLVCNGSRGAGVNVG